jgi:transcriptional regulator with XRE-family HTH domain
MTALRSPEYRAFLKRLIAARKEAKLSQAEVAKQISKPQSFVSKSELGERRIDIIELARLARVYKKPLSYFIPVVK